PQRGWSPGWNGRKPVHGGSRRPAQDAPAGGDFVRDGYTARMPATRVIAAVDYRRERWKNDAGWTRQIHAEPRADGGPGWDWRLSIAEIEQDAPFSAVPGADGELVLLEGHGLRLRFAVRGGGVLVPPHARHRLAGGRALRRAVGG